MALGRYSGLGREGMRSTAERRHAPATRPWDFTDENGDPIPGAIQRPKPRQKKPPRVKAGKEWSGGTKGPCSICAPMRRPRSRQAHHVLPQRMIRDYVRSLRLEEKDARALARKLLNDKRNRMWLCCDCHADFEHGNLTIYRDQLPIGAFDFARELSERYVARLEQMYPTRDDGE